MSQIALALRQPIYRRAKWLFQEWHEHRAALVLGSGQRRSYLPESLRIPPRREVIGIVLGVFFLIKRGYRIRHKIDVHNVDLVARTERQYRQPCQEHKCPHYVELRRLCPPAVSQNNTWPKNRDMDILQQLSDHVLASFFCACAW